MVSFLHTSRSSTARIPQVHQIHPWHRVYFLHPLLPWSASLPSSLAACQHQILFHTVCSHHMAKELHLLFCCHLSQRQNSSCLSDLHLYLSSLNSGVGLLFKMLRSHHAQGSEYKFWLALNLAHSHIAVLS